MKLVVTCEHGGNHIPEDFKKYFIGQEVILDSHRGYDLGALDLFKTLEPHADFTLFSKTSRLLIELNRSLHHPKLFSEFTKALPINEKQTLIASYYVVYRNQVENTIKTWIKKGETVLHVSVHSFTPILNDEPRNCDIGLLYDSKKYFEKVFCKILKTELIAFKPDLSVRYNYPYLGKADGFTTYLRKKFSSNYIGIEIEVNQKHTMNNQMNSKLKTALISALNTTLNNYFS